MTVKITHVGQELWYVPNSKGATAQKLTVISIGRKWAHLSWCGVKADLKTGEVDGVGYSSPGCVYNSQADYTEEAQRQNTIRCFANRVNHWSLRDASTENIIAAAKLLGISLEAV